MIATTGRASAPTRAQVRQARAVVEWYLSLYYGRPDDPGVPHAFCDPARVGHFAVAPAALKRAEPDALFRLLVAVAMFQRRQDVQILRILRGMRSEDAAEIASAPRLLRLIDSSPCEHAKSLAGLVRRCDLTKDPVTKVGVCTANTHVRCHLKRHTVALKRWGHFGKMPSSIALSLRESGAEDLRDLRRAVLRRHRDPLARAQALESALGSAWRVNQKIACMFLSAVSNPAFLKDAAWRRGIAWTHYVVVDSNVDLFLKAIAYRGVRTYDARRAFIQGLASKIDLRKYDANLDAYNPRVVQQALYLFMSVANRRAIARDCSKLGVAECRRCPRAVAALCPLRRTS
jgi:hypothetical protein